MLSSKDLIEKTGISRATLNNYIGLGILSKPVVMHSQGGGGGAKLLGYFPDSALDRIDLVRRLKAEGLTMAEIAGRIGGQGQEPADNKDQRARLEDGENPRLGSNSSLPSPERRALRLTVDDLPHPAYMVDYNFGLAWYNDLARQRLLGGFEILSPKTEARSVFLMLLKACIGKPVEYRNELLRLHFSVAKERFSRSGILNGCGELGKDEAELLGALYDDAERITGRAIVEIPLELREPDRAAEAWRVYVSYFREGILFVHIPAEAADSALLDFLSRRDVVIRNLLRRRLPVLTQLAVLVADLQSSVKICSELPPEEYFELINEIWSTMGPIFRKYYGTHGKHVGDGMVYYFFPQPDSNYIFNALACAQEVKLAMRKVSKDWQLRKNWLNELYLNTGLQEGQEWLGTFQSATSIEFAVLGDTINHAARLSDFARFGAIWATKNLVSKLAPEERSRVEFGVIRRGQDDRDHFIPSSYVQLGGLVDLNSERHERLREIAALPITEIRGVRPEA